MYNQKYLTFSLTSKIKGMISTSGLKEIIYLQEDKILPIFGLPCAVMGAFSFRAKVLCLVDLACLLGLPPLYDQTYIENYNVLVMTKKEEAIGLATQKIGKMIALNKIQVITESALNFPQEFVQCNQGKKVIINNQSVFLLNLNEILQLLNN